MGKMKQVSQPHAPGAAPVWTTYNYDGLGRTTSVIAPDGSSTTTYSYSGNTVTVTDPAGRSKTFTMDAFGNLKQVQEGGDTTTYTYDMLNHLTQVSMPRSGYTQTRTFNYTAGTTVGVHLLSATNPENGTVSYTYNADHTLATKTDAKGQVFTFGYDVYKRVTTISVGGNVLRTYSYDTNSIDSSYSWNSAGRLTTITYPAINYDVTSMSGIYFCKNSKAFVNDCAPPL
jgi:YD repeat-containing protein